MKKFRLKTNIILLLFLSVIVTAILTPLFSLFGYADTSETELSNDDLDTLRYYHKPTIEENFKDNEVWVIFKSAYDDLKELKFEDLAIIETVSEISYIWYSGNEFTHEDYIIVLKENETHHQFNIVFKEHNKEKILTVCELLQTLDMVLCAEPDYIYDVVDMATSSDTYYSKQWGLNGANGINIEQAWDITRGDSSVKVGVMESNIDMVHEDLSGRVFQGNFSPSGSVNKDHGTHVAGIIGAKQDNKGVAGIAECTMYLLSGSNFVQSITYANENNIKVINASFAFIIDSTKSGPSNYESFNSDHYEVLKKYNGLFVASAGNDNHNNDTKHHYPSDYDLSNVISVGAIDSNGAKRASSNYGKATVDLFAPGGDIYSTIPGDNYCSFSGTSMAAPHVAGVAALIYSMSPNMSASQVKSIILDNVSKSSYLSNYCVTGGRLDAYKALNVLHNQTHTEYYEFYNKDVHKVFCEDCDYIGREEAHDLVPYVSASNLSMLNTYAAVKPIKFAQRCTKCNIIIYSDGTIGGIHAKDDDEIM